MKILNNILLIIYTIYAIIIFLIVSIPTLPIFPALFLLLPYRTAFSVSSFFEKWWSLIFLWLIGMPVIVRGRKNVPRETCVIMSNHQSQLDIPITAISSPVPCRFLSKKEVAKIPFLAYILKKKHLTVDRKSPESRAESMRMMEASLQEGIPVLIFPEGTRNPGPALLRKFYDGGFRLAVRNQVPIVVQTIVNSYSRQNMNMKYLRPGKIMVMWDDPISTKGLTEQDVPEL